VSPFGAGDAPFEESCLDGTAAIEDREPLEQARLRPPRIENRFAGKRIKCGRFDQ
jgi:hypothetical protein